MSDRSESMRRRFNIAASAVWIERQRQEQLKRDGKIPFTCDDASISHDAKYLVLGEEVGEVARALNDGLSTEHLCAELEQVAAVAIAWRESLL